MGPEPGLLRAFQRCHLCDTQSCWGAPRRAPGSPRLPFLPRFSPEVSFLSVAAPPNPNREVAGDTIIFRDTQVSSRAVYQCNTSNEHGYLLANAFVSVLGACPVAPRPRSAISRAVMCAWSHVLLRRPARLTGEAWRLEMRCVEGGRA